MAEEQKVIAWAAARIAMPLAGHTLTGTSAKGET